MARRIETLFDRYRRRGDVAALGKVFDRTAPEILRVSMHLTRHPAEAEDLLQETFLTAIARAETYDRERPLVPWLLGILRNHARAHRRRRRPRPAGAPTDVSLREPWMDVPWDDRIAPAVEALPDPYREVLVLLLRHDRAPAEIAILLDRPPATVRSQIHRGLDRLRRRLEPDQRSGALAALPIGIGLDGVRTQVMAEATAAGVGTTVTAGTLLLTGGLAMSSKQIWMSLALLTLAAVGIGIAPGGWLSRSSRDEPEPAPPPREIAGPADMGHTPPELVGAPATPDAPPTRPPDLPIPADKGSVAGRVLFEDGTPVVGERVALWGSSTVTSVTDAQGRYHIHGEWVHPRSVFIRLGREDDPDYDWLGILLSTPVEMKPGELVMRDVVIDRGVDLEGTVADAQSGEPLPRVKLVLRRKGHTQDQAEAGFLYTDGKGRFRFPYVPTDTYTLALVRDGYEAVLREFDLAASPFPTWWSMNPARRLVLAFENLPDSAIGTPVSVDLDRPELTTFNVSSEKTIESDGTLHLDAPEPGRYRLTIHKTDHVPRIRRDIEIGTGPLEPIRIALPRGARVEGTIHDAEGRPIAKARVDIGASAGRPTTDAEGTFAFERVREGRRTVRVCVEGAWIRFGTIEVPAGGTFQVDLTAPGRARLEAVFRLGGKPMSGNSGEVRLCVESYRDAVATARPDARGHVAFPLLPAGRYTVVAWAFRGVPHVQTVDLDRGQSLDLGEIDVRTGARIPVELVFPGAEVRPSDVTVLAFDPSHPPSKPTPHVVKIAGSAWLVSPWVEQDDQGRTWVAGLTVGRHRLDFRVEGHEDVVLEVDAAQDSTDTIRVEFRPR